MKEDIAACQHTAWAPLFPRHVLRSSTLPLSEAFIDFLVEDGVFLPDSSAALPRRDAENDDDSSDDTDRWDGPHIRSASRHGRTYRVPLVTVHSDSSSTDDDDAGGRDSSSSSSNSDGICESDAAAAAAENRDWTMRFPDLHVAVAAAVTGLGGRVVPKLNWSCPTDAVWVNPRACLSCSNADEVVLMLKSSDRIAHDVELLQSLNQQRQHQRPDQQQQRNQRHSTPHRQQQQQHHQQQQQPQQPHETRQQQPQQQQQQQLAMHTGQRTGVAPHAWHALVTQAGAPFPPSMPTPACDALASAASLCPISPTDCRATTSADVPPAFDASSDVVQPSQPLPVAASRSRPTASATTTAPIEILQPLAAVAGSLDSVAASARGGPLPRAAIASSLSNAAVVSAIGDAAHAHPDGVPVAPVSHLYPGTAPGDACEVRPVLVLKRWYDLRPEREFRCFVHQRHLAGVSQRDVTQHFPQLLEEVAALRMKLVDFHRREVADVFPLSDYTYDVYVSSAGTVKILDFNPVGGTTSPLLFDWAEVGLEGAATAAASHADLATDSTGDVPPARGDPSSVSSDTELAAAAHTDLATAPSGDVPPGRGDTIGSSSRSPEAAGAVDVDEAWSAPSSLPDYRGVALNNRDVPAAARPSSNAPQTAAAGAAGGVAARSNGDQSSTVPHRTHASLDHVVHQEGDSSAVAPAGNPPSGARLTHPVLPSGAPSEHAVGSAGPTRSASSSAAPPALATVAGPASPPVAAQHLVPSGFLHGDDGGDDGSDSSDDASSSSCRSSSSYDSQDSTGAPVLEPHPLFRIVDASAARLRFGAGQAFGMPFDMLLLQEPTVAAVVEHMQRGLVPSG